MTAPVLVTGGTTLGRLVVARLRGTGRDVRVLSRHCHRDADGVEFVPGDRGGRAPRCAWPDRVPSFRSRRSTVGPLGPTV